MTLVRQAEFLEFMATEASHYPAFRLVMGANVRELVESDGIVRGVRFQATDGWHEVQALLTVGADGRFSRLRQLSRLPAPIKTSPPIDILWFGLSKQPGDPEGIMGGFNMGRGLIMLERTDYWQLGYVLPKGSYQQRRLGRDGPTCSARGIGSYRTECVVYNQTMGTDGQRCSMKAS